MDKMIEINVSLINEINVDRMEFPRAVQQQIFDGTSALDLSVQSLAYNTIYA